MGSNKRYGSDVSASTVARVDTSGPASLYREETGDRITEAVEPLPVRAWVRLGLRPLLVEAHAHSWTPTAVLIVFGHLGVQHSAWVWASAVARR